MAAPCLSVSRGRHGIEQNNIRRRRRDRRHLSFLPCRRLCLHPCCRCLLRALCRALRPIRRFTLLPDGIHRRHFGALLYTSALLLHFRACTLLRRCTSFYGLLRRLHRHLAAWLKVSALCRQAPLLLHACIRLHPRCLQLRHCRRGALHPARWLESSALCRAGFALQRSLCRLGIFPLRHALRPACAILRRLLGILRLIRCGAFLQRTHSAGE